MSNIGKIERVKLVATLLNTLAAAVITIGSFGPIVTSVYDGTLFNRNFNDFINGFVICLCAAAVLHLLGQGILTTLDRIDDDDA